MMTPAWKTSEFWMAMITNIVGIVALLGYVTSDQATALVDGLSRVVGAVLMILTSFGYIKARTALRTAIAEALAVRAFETHAMNVFDSYLADLKKAKV